MKSIGVLAVAIVVLVIAALIVSRLVPATGTRSSSTSTTSATSTSSSATSATVPVTSAGLTVVNRSVDQNCASTGRHLGSACTVSAVLRASGQSPSVRVQLSVPTARYQTSPTPPYTVSIAQGPSAACGASVPALSAPQQSTATCTIKAPAGYGFDVTSGSQVQVALIPGPS